MFNPEHDPVLLHDQYLQATPFPHLIIDNFLQPTLALRLADELEQADIATWHRDEHPDQLEKRSMNRYDRLPPTVGDVLAYFNSPAAIAFFENLTGISNLIADPEFMGGGVHVSGRGGLLSVHADFNLHPDSGLHRRVNALLYLNRDWDPNWNGQLELWPSDLSAAVEMVDPILNRLAVFTITDTAFHGMPRPLLCPPDRRRLSLALYYYSEDRPEEEKAPFHWASWQVTPSDDPPA